MTFQIILISEYNAFALIRAYHTWTSMTFNQAFTITNKHTYMYIWNEVFCLEIYIPSPISHIRYANLIIIISVQLSPQKGYFAHNIELKWARHFRSQWQLEQLERLRSEDTPRRPMITHTIDQFILNPKSILLTSSYQIPSQNKVKAEKLAKNCNFRILL